MKSKLILTAAVLSAMAGGVHFLRYGFPDIQHYSINGY